MTMLHDCALIVRSVYLIRHKETRHLFAMKRLLNNHLILRNQVEQVLAERDILTFSDNPFVVSFYCSFVTKVSLTHSLTHSLTRSHFSDTVQCLEGWVKK